MLIEITDFPSDPNGETGDLRKVLLTVLRKVDAHPDKSKLVREILNFSGKTLTAINKSHSEATKKAAALDAAKLAEAEEALSDKENN